MVASNETVLKAHTTYISKQLYAIVCGEGVCKTIDLTTYIQLILFLNEQSYIFTPVFSRHIAITFLFNDSINIKEKSREIVIVLKLKFCFKNMFHLLLVTNVGMERS